MQRFAATAAAVLSVLAASGVAHAAWSPPRALPGALPKTDVVGLELGLRRDFAWWFDDEWREGQGIGVATRTHRGPWRGPRELPPSGGPPDIVPVGGGRLVEVPNASGITHGVLLNVLDYRGRIRRTSRLDRPNAILWRRQLASSPRGTAALAWTRWRSDRRTPLLVSLRRRHGDFGPARRVAANTQLGVPSAIAVNDRGDVLVAWAQRARVKARLLRSDGRRGRLTVLHRGYSDARVVSAALTPSGRGAVAWSGNTFGTKGPVAVAEMRRRGSFRRQRYLTTPAEGGEPNQAQVASVGAAELALAWESGSDDEGAVHAATLRDGRVTARRQLSDPNRDSELLDLEAGGAGQARVLWVSDRERAAPEGVEQFQSDELFTVRRRRGGRFATSERVTSSARHIAAGELAFGPSGRRTAAIWIDGPSSDTDVLAAYAR